MPNVTVEAGVVLLSDVNQRALLFSEGGAVSGWELPSAQAPPDDGGFGYTIVNIDDGHMDMKEWCCRGVGASFEETMKQGAGQIVSTELIDHYEGLLLSRNFSLYKREDIIIIHNIVALPETNLVLVETFPMGQDGIMWEEILDKVEEIVITNS